MQAVKGMKTLRPRWRKTQAKERERFDYLKGTFFWRVPFIVYCPAKSEVAFLCFTFAVPDFPHP